MKIKFKLIWTVSFIWIFISSFPDLNGVNSWGLHEEDDCRLIFVISNNIAKECSNLPDLVLLQIESSTLPTLHTYIHSYLENFLICKLLGLFTGTPISLRYRPNICTLIKSQEIMIMLICKSHFRNIVL